MALGNTLATQVAVPQINTVANFQASQANAQQMEAQKQQMASSQLEAKRKGMEGIYMMSAGLLRDGEVSPDEWEQALDMMEQGGSDPEFVKTLRGRPDMANILAQGSGEALKFSQDERLMDLRIEEMAAQIEAAKLKAGAPIEVSAGATLYDPGAKEGVFTAPEKAPTATDDQRELAQINEERKAAGKPLLSTEEYLASKKGQGLNVTTNPDGTVSVTQGGKLTEGQSKDIGFYTRGLQANKGLGDLESQLTDFWMSKADLIPLGIGNYAKTPEFRQAKIEGDNFLTAILRKDTGAAITDKEFDIYGPMFLPVPGDDEGTIALKRQKRATALMAIRSGLGTAEAVAAANEGVLGLDTPTNEAVGGGDVLDWTEMDWDN